MKTLLLVLLLFPAVAFAGEPECSTQTYQSLDTPSNAACSVDSITDANRAALQRAQGEDHGGLDFLISQSGGENADARLKQTAAKAPWLVGLSISDVTELAPLKSLKKLRRLEIYSLGLKDVSAIAALTQLETLILKLGEPVDLAVLAKLPKLKRLRLDLRQDIDPHLLDKLANLVELRIDAKLATSEGIAKLTKLEVLELAGGVTITSSQLLAGLHGLKHLRVSEKGLHELDGLAGLTALTTLDLSKSGVTRVDGVGKLPALRKRALDEAPLADATPLAALPALEELRLSGTQVRDVTALAKGLPALRLLYLDGTRVTDARALLPRAKTLRSLKLPKGVDMAPFTAINHEL